MSFVLVQLRGIISTTSGNKVMRPIHHQRGTHVRRAVAIVIFLFVGSAGPVLAQVDDICTEAGLTPSLDSPFAHVPYVFGRVLLTGTVAGQKRRKVSVIFSEGQHTNERQRLNDSGNFCFRRRGSGGTLVVEIDGVEVARRTLVAASAVQQREDFEVAVLSTTNANPPSVISARFTHPTNEKTIQLYKKATEAEADQHRSETIEYLKQIVLLDPADFIAWAKLGSIYFEQKNFADAEAAFRKALENRIDYSPAWLFMGQIRIEQKQFLAAVEILKHATTLDARSARAFQLLGQAYLHSKQGTLGVAALNQAIKLDPIGMAECHLQIAHLYDLAGAKARASAEYRMFLEKVPGYPDKKRLEEFIKHNP